GLRGAAPGLEGHRRGRGQPAREAVLRAGAADAPARDPRRACVSAPRKSRFGIVLVDDDDELRGLVRSVLDESPRFEVLAEAGDGPRAVSLAIAQQPDVMLLDLSMPVMSGLEALEPIRQASPRTKVVVLSNFPQRRLGPLLLSRGAVGYLEKGGALVDLPERLL